MKLLIALSAIVFAVTPATVRADTTFVNGNILLERCRPGVDDPSTQILVGNCYGYVAGAVDTFEILQSAKIIDRYYCMPNGVSVEQLAAITVKYLNDNPSERHNIGSSLILKALIQSFPCDRD
ncbi:Rap1a/Tai family immunity protein [Qipengyuania qiaonensis]|uniref:Rap1a immunity protein domain-containing protein n=1 Tax=Qipengyuania qiaonensis TaxID=2867240 RepID=A0ABS7J7I4_9SPHN|nr:Rap1a/Tai family immunity protein [Qipengyuania qiaonensis]MBX7480957.1 hypothetical protein [Qipengyuania qiaonensis]